MTGGSVEATLELWALSLRDVKGRTGPVPAGAHGGLRGSVPRSGHKTPDLVLWLCAHGVMPLYTPVGGSWLNMAESIERVLKHRALDGQHPHSPEEIGSWFEQTARSWNSSQPRLCGTANAGSGGDDPMARRSTGSVDRAPAPSGRSVEPKPPQHQNARTQQQTTPSWCG